MRSTILNPFVESRVDLFEESLRNAAKTRLESFLPPDDHEHFAELLTELVRVELEWDWTKGQQTCLDDYVHRFPKVFSDKKWLSDAAFEEFRQRRESGEVVNAEEYSTTYQVDTKDWDQTTAVKDSCNVIAPATGTEWQDFELVREIGRGSFGAAVLARQPNLANREVVLKYSNLSSEEGTRLATLQHTNIVPVYSLHPDGETSAICMPFLGETTIADFVRLAKHEPKWPDDGQTLASLLPAARSSGEAMEFYCNHSHVDSSLWIIARLADALNHAHRRGILHCDIKPANILLRDDGEPMLIDFNLSADVDATDEARIGGTLAYTSPEQLRRIDDGVTKVDERSDIYALGAVLFQLLTGNLPFEVSGGSRDNLAEWIAVKQEATPACSGSSEITPAVRSIVGKCLAPNPMDRYQDASELRDDLRSHLDSRPLQFAENRSIAESVRKWKRRNPWAFSMWTAGLLIAVFTAASISARAINARRAATRDARALAKELTQHVLEASPALAEAAIDLSKAEAALEIADEIVMHYDLNAAAPPKELRLLSPREREQWSDDAARLYGMAAAVQTASAQRFAANGPALLESANQWNQFAERWSRQAATSSSTPDRVDRQRMTIEIASSGGTSTLLVGLEQFLAGDPQGALVSFRNAAKQRPTDAAAWLLLAEAQSLCNDPESARASVDVADALIHPSHIPICRRGLFALRAGDYETAQLDFTEALRRRPNLDSALLNRALAFKSLGRLEDALADVDAAIRAGCIQTRVHFVRANILRGLGDLDGANLARKAGLQAEPSDELSWIARGFAKQTTDPKGAVSDYRKALELNPLSTTALQNTASVLSESLNSPEAAIEALSRALEIEPSAMLSRAGRGVLLARLGNVELALDDACVLSEARNLKPIVRYQLACIYALCCDERPQLLSNSIRELTRCFREDVQLASIAKMDKDLDGIRTSERFEDLMKAVAQLEELSK